jgi:hypothetical protein
MRAALPVLTVVFWAAASICVVMIAMYAFTQSMGGVVVLDDRHIIVGRSGVLRRYRLGCFRSNPKEDAEGGKWTNKMLFYGLVFAITFFVAFLYWLSLYFSR